MALTKACSICRLRHGCATLSQFTEYSDGFIGDSAPIATSIFSPSFGNHIHTVIFNSPHEQMIRVDTRRIIAAVKNE